MMAGKSDFDAFLSSMTFASGDIDIGCECCDPSSSSSSSASAAILPPTIRTAVDEHFLLRKRTLEQSPSILFEGSSSSKKRLYIRQNRELLIKREGGFSIWRLDLPALVGGCDPIIEYRNHHRILFVKQLNKMTSNILSIGQGIIGSAAEENSRKRVNWEEGESYLLPCSKGIACGWIHKLATNDHDDGESDKTDRLASTNILTPVDAASDVVIYALKVSPEILQSMETNDLPEETSSWVKYSLELFRQCLAKLQPQNGDSRQDKSNDDSNIAGEGIPLSEEESLTANLIIENPPGWFS